MEIRKSTIEFVDSDNDILLHKDVICNCKKLRRIKLPRNKKFNEPIIRGCELIKRITNENRLDYLISKDEVIELPLLVGQVERYAFLGCENARVLVLFSTSSPIYFDKNALSKSKIDTVVVYGGETQILNIGELSQVKYVYTQVNSRICLDINKIENRRIKLINLMLLSGRNIIEAVKYYNTKGEDIYELPVDEGYAWKIEQIISHIL